MSKDCVMVMVHHPHWPKILETIKDEDLYTGKDDAWDDFGKTTDPHVTVLYGLIAGTLQNEDYKDAIFSYFRRLPPFYIRSTGISIFENDKYDVVKFDIELTEQLEECNEFLKQFPFENSYPEYHPHCTIAYVKKGLGKKYQDTLRHSFAILADYIVYSEADHTRHLIEINQL